MKLSRRRPAVSSAPQALRKALVSEYLVVLLMASLSMASLPTFSQELEMHFIGNMAFRLSDGETTLLSDFPYQSGAFGYNEYDAAEIRDYGYELALITHFHPDHWKSSLFLETDWALIAPKHVLEKVASDQKIAFAPEMRFGDLVIEAFATEHKLTREHYSYLVRWPGVGGAVLRLYFTGDTETTEQLLAVKDLDVAFVSPWLLQAVADAGATIDARKVMIYHHRTGERVVEYQQRIVPAQGDSFIIEFSSLR